MNSRYFSRVIRAATLTLILVGLGAMWSTNFGIPQWSSVAVTARRIIHFTVRGLQRRAESKNPENFFWDLFF